MHVYFTEISQDNYAHFTDEETKGQRDEKMTGFKSHGKEPATDIPRPVCLIWRERRNRPARSKPGFPVRLRLIFYPL